MNLYRAMRGICVVAGLLIAASLSTARADDLTVWSFWGDLGAKRSFIDETVKRFEAAHPGTHVKISWYDKNSLYAGLKTALRAGAGPDVFYAENDQVEYIDNDLLLDLSTRLNWNAIEPWAKQAWTFDGKAYALPLEATTQELYYNTKMLADLGVTLPANRQLDQVQFLDLIKKAQARGITPISLGVGDRPYPGTALTGEALLKELGPTDYGRLLKGEVKWSDPRVVKALTFVKQMIDAGALPKSFSTMTLGEAHIFFYGTPRSLMFLNGSFYPSRAFNPPDQGGQPADFPLGIMEYPALDGAACNACKTLSVGGSYVVNADTKHADLAVAFLNTMATPDMAKLWASTVMGQSGIKADLGEVGGPRAKYLADLEAVNKDATFFQGQPVQLMRGAARDTFTQVINQAFPAGLLTVDQVVQRMDAVKY
jgi:multiple sugar transport system substrate-binding protein